MSNDHTQLERAIRDALHGPEITETDLNYRALRTTQRRPGPSWAVGATVAFVAAIAVVIAVFVTNTGGRHRQQAGADSLAGIVGYRWRVTQLVDEQGSTAVPSSLNAEIGFTRDGYVLGDDTVNALQAKYSSTTGGYTATDGASTLVGSAGLDSIQKRTVAAVDAMFVQTVADLKQTPPPLVVTAAVNLNGDLTLGTAGTQLTLTKVGVQPGFFAQQPSPTATTGIPSSTSTAEPTASALQELTKLARSAATANKDPNATGEAVRTTYGDAERVVFDGDHSSTPPADTEVWVIQLHGSFTCLSCSVPSGAGLPTGRAVVLVVNAKTFEGYGDGITKTPHDLAQLGTVVRLPL